MLLISAFPVRNAFLHHLSSILLSDLFCHFWIFLSSTSIVRFEHCPIVQGHPNPSRFSGGNKWCLHQTFFKANIEPQQLCAETNVCWWASVAKQFWWRRFEPIQRRSSRDKSVSSRYKSVFTRTPVSDSFGCFWNVRITVKWYERLQIEGSQPIQTMSIHFVSNWSAVASLSPATGLLVSFHPGYSWSFGARTFLGGSNVFLQQRPK